MNRALALLLAWNLAGVLRGAALSLIMLWSMVGVGETREQLEALGYINCCSVRDQVPTRFRGDG